MTFQSDFAGELIVDSFAGGGGASTGIELALGRSPDVAINHNPVALALHRANHPQTKHYVEDIFDVDPREVCAGRPVGLAWFSPDCTHFSRAKGGKPRSKTIRGLAWVVVRWAKEVRPRVIVLENVEEFQTWGPLDVERQPIKSRAGETFRKWKAELSKLGYQVEHRSLVAADYGTPTTRKRFFLVARCDGHPIEWPEPTHGEGRSEPWRPAADIIDWALPCPSIFERKRPLADKTLARIAAGVRRYVIEAARPFIVPLTHTGRKRVHGIDEPVRTVTGANRGELAFVAPTIISHYGQSVGRESSSPLPTVTAGGGGHHGLVCPTLIQTGYGERKGQAPRALDISKPLGTVVAGGAKHAVVAAFLSKHYTGVVGHGVDRALGTVTSQDHHSVTAAFLTKFYGSSRAGANVCAPLPTVTAGGGKGGGHLAEVRAFLSKYAGEPVQQEIFSERASTIVTVEGEAYEIADIGMRMLQPHELFAAQGFPADYVTELADRGDGRPLTKTQQIALCGNAVCPQVAAAIVRANSYAARENAA